MLFGGAGMTCLLMTRPLSASRRFVDGLPEDLRRGLHVIHSPLIGIEALPATVDFSAIGGLIVTSVNGAEAARRLGAPQGMTCYCVGAETTRAAQQAGLRATCKGQTADQLVAALSELRPEAPLLHLSGRHTRGDIAGRLSALGCPTGQMAVYDQKLLEFSAQARAAMAQSAAIVAPLFPPRAARQFADLWTGDAMLFIAALSPAVSAPVKDLNYKVLDISAEPSGVAMTACVANLLRTVSRVEGGSGAH